MDINLISNNKFTMYKKIHQKAILDLSSRDRQIKKAVKKYGMPEDRKVDGGFQTLFRMIVGQQISVKAANSVWLKLEKINANDPGNLLNITEKKLKSAGLSKQKINYSKDLASKTVTGELNFSDLGNLSYEEVHKKLTSIKGIGDWTADIYQLFVLCDMDAFPHADIAVQEGARIFFNLNHRPKPEELIKLVETWSPLRGAGALVMWQIYRKEVREGSTTKTIS